MEENFVFKERHRAINAYNRVVANTYLCLCVAFLISALASSLTIKLIAKEMINTGVAYVCIFLELALVIYLSKNLEKFSLKKIRYAFVIFSAATGVILTSIFVTNKLATVVNVFIDASIIFGLLAALIKITKITIPSQYLAALMYLPGSFLCVITSNIVCKMQLYSNSWYNDIMYDTSISVVVISVFFLIIRMNESYFLDIASEVETIEDKDEIQKISLISSLKLYLSLINIFAIAFRIFRIGNKKVS